MMFAYLYQDHIARTSWCCMGSVMNKKILTKIKDQRVFLCIREMVLAILATYDQLT